MNIKNFLENKFHLLFFVLTFTKNFLFSNLKIFFIAKINGLKLFNRKILKFKKSDTLFILAGGESINEITETQWNTIKNSDSIGINRWLIHKFVPTFLLIEGGKKQNIKKEIDSGIKPNSFNYKLWELSKKRCSNLILIVRAIDNLVLDFKLLKKSFSKIYYIFNNTPSNNNLLSLFKSYNLLKKFNLHNFISAPPGYRGSVSYALSLGLSMGYKNIVLCGIDMQGINFWETNNAKNIFLKPDKNDKINNILTTVNSDIELYNFKNIIYMTDELLTKKDQKIFVNSKKSLLSEKLEVYW